MVDSVEASQWTRENCFATVDGLRNTFLNEKRAVRNWNEGLEGEAHPALLSALKGVRDNLGNEERFGWFLEAGLVEVLLARLRRCPPEEERPLIRWGLYATYAEVPSARAELRAEWGRQMSDFLRTPTWRFVISPLLGALRCVIDGMSSSSSSSGEVLTRLISRCLGPLHKINDFAEWRDQIPLMGTYHAELSACMISAIKKVSPSTGAMAMRAVLDAWPPTSAASTSKEIVLLGEIEDILVSRQSLSPGAEYAFTDESLDDALQPILSRFASCIASENWRLVERALHMWRREDFATRFSKRATETCAHILPALLRDGKPHWNPTVNRMTVLVLDRLERMGKAPFEKAAATCSRVVQDDVVEDSMPTVVASPAPPEHVGDVVAPMKEKNYAAAGSLARDMRGWRPGSSAPPPASITGVAPWATEMPAKKKLHHHSDSNHLPSVHETDGLERVHSFKEACASLAAQAGGGFGSTVEEEEALKKEWAAALTAETPSQLPELKFHDLVFGREIGTGAFGVVKYAKRIVRMAPRSSSSSNGLAAQTAEGAGGGIALSRAHWPDYAVKVLSRQKVEFHRYEGSIAREICVLRQLNHPGIARLISAFKWRHDVYLVLEYAEGGDLHENVSAEGALDLDSTRFVVGSIVAALQSIHDKGLVYADLKPENVLLTAAGHVKLTDFGACRGVSAEANEKLNEAASEALTTLRSGDWKEETNQEAYEKGSASAAAAAQDDLSRVEGTMLYLAPEVVRGVEFGMPADVWALGCVVHFCAEARPRFEADSDEQAKAQILAFDVPTVAPTTPRETVAFERSLLDPDPATRPLLVDVAANPFFQCDVHSIYRSPPISPLGRAEPGRQERITPPPDAKWAQRQYSMIWAPLETAQVAAKRQEQKLGAWIHIDVVPETDGEKGVEFTAARKNTLDDNRILPSSVPRAISPPPPAEKHLDSIVE